MSADAVSVGELTNDPRVQRARAFGVLMLAGGALAALTALVPPAAEHSDTVVLAIGLLGVVTGTVLLATRRRVPTPLIALVAIGATAMLTLATYEGGYGENGTSDNQMLYAWICIFAFFFLSFRQALVQLAVIGASYGLLLASEPIDFANGATRWLVTMTALLTGGVLVARLRRSNQRLVGQLAERARVDPLTGLLNRSALAERASSEFARAKRTGGSISMLILDIDDFKAVNDSLGHPAGDEVLKKVAEVLAAHTREVDAVARVGGDEFAILLPDSTATAARLIAERLREGVRFAGDAPHPTMSLSIGIAVAPDDGADLDELWKAADRAMYSAKHSGRDRVAAAGESERATEVDARPEAASAAAYD